MSKLVIIDGNAILHRAFHAMPPLTTRNGEPINAVYGLVSMFLRIIQDLKPEAIVVTFDEKEKTFRHKEFESYQSQRPPTHEDLSSQFEKARDFFKATNVPVYSKPGYEADDVIGTLAKQATEIQSKSPTDEVVIVTGDRDLLQLVDDKKNIKLYMPVVGLSNAKLYGEKEVKERMGVPANLIPDYKALVGDPSDNYPGVMGIGPKTAEKLLEEFGSVDKIYTHLTKIEPKIRQKLESNKNEAKLFHRLATVVRDVPIKIDFPQMEKWKIDSPDVLKLFEEFGFKTLMDRIKKVGKEVDAGKQSSLF
ncbi:MAG: hypothetical protein ACD_13C00236G0004 [uncultured bacterium]|nr:MAG: hypothetical protein ACD_13C00236G0004 [uncultured bacterium]